MKQKGELCMYKLIIIEDHKMLRDMIAETLNSQDDFEVVATSGNAKDSLQLCNKYKPDLILMDICTEENSSGIAYSKILKKELPDVKIVVMDVLSAFLSDFTLLYFFLKLTYLSVNNSP